MITSVAALTINATAVFSAPPNGPTKARARSNSVFHPSARPAARLTKTDFVFYKIFTGPPRLTGLSGRF